MPVPTIITDLSSTAASNSPAGTDTIGTSLDDYLRAIQAVMRAEVGGAFSDVASDTTTDIGAVASTNVRITGTNPITGLGTCSAGISRNIRFAAALTLTYNATSLILPTAADIVTAANDTMRAVSLGSGNWLVTNYQRANGTPAGGASFKVGNTTYDLSTATGTQAITGVGFKPKAVILFGCVNGSAGASFGFSDASTHGVVYDDNATSADTWTANTSNAMYFIRTSGNYQVATVSALGADGFTLSWTKTGTPTGTAQILYLAIR